MNFRSKIIKLRGDKHQISEAALSIIAQSWPWDSLEVDKKSNSLNVILKRMENCKSICLHGTSQNECALENVMEALQNV